MLSWSALSGAARRLFVRLFYYSQHFAAAQPFFTIFDNPVFTFLK